MSTSLYYNGITISNCLTKTCSSERVTDEFSGVDTIYIRHRICVVGQCHVYASPTEPLRPDVYKPRFSPPETNAPLTFVKVRKLLLEPRKPFEYKFGENVILEAIPPPSATLVELAVNDVNNGPRPIRCDITHITGTTTLQVEFEIEVCTVDCAELNNSTGVLSNRWTAGDDIDENWYTTRTINGKLRLASIDFGGGPQGFRNWCFPPLQDGFKRSAMRFVTSPDGLSIDYTITDQQRFASCPLPGTTWEGQHTVSTENGYLSSEEITVRMTGPPGADKRELIGVLLNVSLSKLRMRTVATIGTVILKKADITDSLHDSTAEMRIAIDRVVPEGAPPFNIETTELGKPVEPGADYNPKRHLIPSSYGEADPTGLLICYLQSPCLPDHAIPPGETINPEDDSPGRSQGDTQIFTYTGPTSSLAAQSPGTLSNAHLAAAFTFQQIDNEYPVDYRRAQCPIAAEAGGGSASPSQENEESADTCAIVDLSRPTARRIVRITMERVGAFPIMPEPASFTDIVKHTLLHFRPVFAAPELLPDAYTYKYMVKAEYVYALSRPLNKSEQFDIGIMPGNNPGHGLQNAIPWNFFSQTSDVAGTA